MVASETYTTFINLYLGDITELDTAAILKFLVLQLLGCRLRGRVS